MAVRIGVRFRSSADGRPSGVQFNARILQQGRGGFKSLWSTIGFGLESVIPHHSLYSNELMFVLSNMIHDISLTNNSGVESVMLALEIASFIEFLLLLLECTTHVHWLPVCGGALQQVGVVFGLAYAIQKSVSLAKRLGALCTRKPSEAPVLHF
jgi:hypothetical protein